MNADLRIQASFQLDWPGFSLDVDLDLPGRGVSAIFGHSGSGKTSLLRCIAGLERARKGFMAFHGEVWQDQERFLPTHRRPLGYVFQEPSLFSHLSVLGNLRYGQRRLAATAQISLDHAIELLGIEHLLARRPDRLSGGERQRVGIARALAVSPRVLLMDEPLAALDLARKREILPYLERLRDELDIPILYVSHSPDEVARLADHLIVLEQGKVLASGALSDILSRIDLPILLGEDAGIVLNAHVVERDEPWHLARVSFAGGSLWLRDHGLPVGSAVRLRILARDVSIALDKVVDASFLNVLPATVRTIGDDTHPATALVRLDVNSTPLLARLTRRSAAGLGIQPGKPVWIQIKAVALIE